MVLFERSIKWTERKTETRIEPLGVRLLLRQHNIKQGETDTDKGPKEDWKSNDGLGIEGINLFCRMRPSYLDSVNSQEDSREIKCMENSTDNVLESISQNSLVSLITWWLLHALTIHTAVKDKNHDGVVQAIKDEKAKESNDKPNQAGGIYQLSFSFGSVI